jgi:NAD dependent epimerase/dehydratase family enzyme
VLGRPARLRVPAVALHLRFGELGDVLLWSQRVVPGRLVAAGYRFRFPSLPAALADLVGSPAGGR